MTVQLLLTRRPICCTRCMHGHAVEVVTGRENAPTEYHCGFCGNYAIAGVPARFPFMEVVKGNSSKPPESGSGSHPQVGEKKGSEAGSSPMQVGESLVKSMAPRARLFTKPAQQAVTIEKQTAKKCKPKEEKIMSTHPICKVEGCERIGAFFGFCSTHFRQKYGITYYKYERARTFKGEDPREVARRIKADNLLTLEKKEKEQQKPEPTPAPGTKPPLPETPWVKSETKAPAAEPLEKNRMVSIPVDVYEKIVQLAEQEFRPVDMQVQYLLHKGMSNG